MQVILFILVYTFCGCLIGFGIGLKVGTKIAFKSMQKQVLDFQKDIIEHWNKNVK